MYYKLILFFIYFLFSSIESLNAQSNKFEIGINYGMLYPKGEDCLEPGCTYQNIKSGKHFGINIKKKLWERFSNRFSLNIQTNKQERLVYYDIYHQGQGTSYYLGFAEGQIIHDFKTLNFNYQISYTLLKKAPVLISAGLSYNRVVKNNSTSMFQSTLSGYIDSNGDYRTRTSPEIKEPDLINLEIQKSFTVFNTGIGYIFKLNEIEVIPNINIYFVNNAKMHLAESGINFNFEINYCFPN